MENPTDVCKAGSGGGGSRRGLITNQTATGIRDARSTLGSGRGPSAGAMSDV